MIESQSVLKTLLGFGLAVVLPATGANAAVNYRLTTHVDGRLIEGSASIGQGDELLASMPRALWRGYCTYKFYADAELTQEVTEAPADDATVYVDYDFDPPFLLSDDESENWLYLRGFTSSARRASDDRFVYYSQYHSSIYNKGDLSTGSMTLKLRTDAQWAFEGDAYCLNMRYNDVNGNTAADYLVPGGTGNGAKVKLGRAMTTGWQVCENTASTPMLGTGFVSFVNPANNHYLTIEDLGSEAMTRQPSYDGLSFDRRNRLVAEVGKEGNLFYPAFIATSVTNGSSTLDIWHVTYKIFMDYQDNKQRGNDIVAGKPVGVATYPELADEHKLSDDDYVYVYEYYKDEAMTQLWTEPMPLEGNTTVYVKELRETLTGVADVKAADAKAAVGDWYTIDGRHVARPERGIYIHAGRKVVVK